MYPLFSSASADAVRASQILALSASIEPLLEGCSYIGFIIQLQDAELERYLKRKEAVAAFVDIVEKRIDARDFARLYIHPASSELDSTTAPRVVFDAGGRVLYNW